MQDANQIGADKTFKDPIDAIASKEGTYKDAAVSLSDAEKYPLLPRPSTKQPFGNLSKPTGRG